MTARSDTGRVRAHNEDAVFCDAGKGLAILADGMGGHQGGAVAANLLIEQLSASLARADFRKSGVETTLALHIEAAHQEIRKVSMKNPALKGMGSTLVAGIFITESLWLAHVGDSRCYLWRDNRLTQLTRDHSLVQESLDQGLLTLEDARFFPFRNILVRAMGVEGVAQPTINRYDIRLGDLYLFSSDGLHEMLEAAEIARVLRQNAYLPEIASALIDAANIQGGEDNVSVILARVENQTQRKFHKIRRKPRRARTF
jgi:protein phosphatase